MPGRRPDTGYAPGARNQALSPLSFPKRSPAMQRSSTKIGALATALAKAQSELANPEKSLVATLPSPIAGGVGQSFRYASLASGLELVRKCLGHHEIATVQATGIDRDTGLIRLTTTLVHASGEWISSDWPVCSGAMTAIPHPIGTALSSTTLP